MVPTIVPRDLILVEKISPFVKRDILQLPPASIGDVVFFSPPPRLMNYIAVETNRIGSATKQKEGTAVSGDDIMPVNRYLPQIEGRNTLLVKRVKNIKSCDSKTIPSKLKSLCYDVRGDNPKVSLDSRQWYLFLIL